ncbi:MAG: hypothetical protein OEZ65_06935 [Gemmatimonadota bacterium]|nr:hypothetical protein [Gemmatimonadota bacterium]MDH5759307.1 hypothetical protein [Gemmatimonadota bacterium]
MNSTSFTETRLEALGDVPGVCELPLTRAVVQYRDVHEADTPGGRIEDIGLALVVQGRFASSAEAVDLGSGNVKTLDLSTELVVLDWVYEPTLVHVEELLSAAALGRDQSGMQQYLFRLGLGILQRVGFGPLSRATFLRIGFRDVCRDFDLHEGTSIRFVLGPGRLTRVHLDYDACALVFRTASMEPDAVLERAVSEAFPHGELRRQVPQHSGGSLSYQVRFSMPDHLGNAREILGWMRKGLGNLMARFEPDRFRSVESLLETFGARETLGTIYIPAPKVQSVRLVMSPSEQRVVH